MRDFGGQMGCFSNNFGDTRGHWNGGTFRLERVKKSTAGFSQEAKMSGNTEKIGLSASNCDF